MAERSERGRLLAESVDPPASASTTDDAPVRLGHAESLGSGAAGAVDGVHLRKLPFLSGQVAAVGTALGRDFVGKGGRLNSRIHLGHKAILSNGLRPSEWCRCPDQGVPHRHWHETAGQDFSLTGIPWVGRWAI